MRRFAHLIMAVVFCVVVLQSRDASAQDSSAETHVTTTSSTSLRTLRLQSRGAQFPESYTFSSAEVELWVFAGSESAVGAATGVCPTPDGHDALNSRLQPAAGGDQVFLMNSGSANAPNLPRSSYVGMCAFRQVNGAWQYVSNLGDVGINEIRVLDENGREVPLGNSNVFAGWLSRGARNRVFQIRARDLYNLTSGRWAYGASASIRVSITPPENASAAVYIPFMMRMSTQTYPHFSIALANSYGFAFGGDGRAIAMPLTIAAGGDWLPFNNSSTYIGFRAILAPSFSFEGGSITQVTAVAFGARIDLDDYFGIGGGAQVNVGDGDVKGIIFASIGPRLLSILTAR